MKRTSIWRDTSVPSDYSCLREHITTDVEIIGGGITGITAGYLLAKAGIKSMMSSTTSNQVKERSWPRMERK
jgi:heterodisulfide reductase subunit A-like polyferredoxin